MPSDTANLSPSNWNKTAIDAADAIEKAESSSVLRDLPWWPSLIHSLDTTRTACELLGIQTLFLLSKRLIENLNPLSSGLIEVGPASLQTWAKDLRQWIQLRTEVSRFPEAPSTFKNASAPAVESTASNTKTAPASGTATTKTVVADMGKYLPLFVEETEEGIESMQTHLLELESGVRKSGFLPSTEAMNELFRHAHKIKASAGAMGFIGLSELTHTMETLLDQIRSHKLRISADLVSALLLALDQVRKEVETAKRGAIPSQNLAEAKASLDWYLDAPTAKSPETHSSGASPSSSDLVAMPSDGVVAAVNQGLPTYRIALQVGLDNPAPELRLFLAVNRLKTLGEISSASTALDSIEKHEGLTFLSLVFESNQDLEHLRNTLASLDLESYIIEPQAVVDNKLPESPAGIASGQSIRVAVDKLDTLMNLSGELAISKNSFIAFSHQLRTLISSTRSQMAHSERVGMAMEESIQQLSQLTTGIQQTVLEMRMIPISPLFERCRRIVRDLSTELGKQIDLVLIGAETSLDKKIIDQLGDPLNHMIRNAVDHGIESPTERETKGKPPMGTITLRAEREGSRICITISDDGRGIPLDRIREKVQQLGLASADKASRMEPQELVSYIFHPGFSTASQVTNISGRGVGMDIVRKRIEEIHGTIEVTSQEGKGTRMRASLPLTVVSQICLLFEVRGVIFAATLHNIAEILRVPSTGLITMPFGKFLRLREELIPVYELDHFFTKTHFNKPPQPSSDSLNLLIVKAGEKRIALLVDSLRGEEEILVKSPGELVGDIHGIAGVSVLSSGNVALILDIENLVERSHHPIEESHAVDNGKTIGTA
jgi:two-component system, chemotaxis family, sensor kinase CheA